MARQSTVMHNDTIQINQKQNNLKLSIDYILTSNLAHILLYKYALIISNSTVISVIGDCFIREHY